MSPAQTPFPANPMKIRFLASLLLGGVAAAAPRPNIVVILADDLGWSDLGCFGGEIPTPHMDALARSGLRFTQFYNNSVCGPSRASLLTGLYAQRVGHEGTKWNQPTDYGRCITLGEALQAAGYRTMAVGKWQDPEMPAQRGFNRFYGPLCSGKISYFSEVATNPFYLDETRVGLPADFYLTDALTGQALNFLEEAWVLARERHQPFFLYFAHVAPHWPLHAREPDIAPHRSRYREKGWNGWSAARRANQLREGLIPADFKSAPWPADIGDWREDRHQGWQAERMAVHAAMVASIDASTGRLIDAIKQAGQFENTLFLLLSDNGAAPDGGLQPTDRMLGFSPGSNSARTFRLDGVPLRTGSGPDNLPGPPNTFAAYGMAWALTSNTPFRSTKLTGYEGGIRTPLIAHWPAGIRQPGRIVREVGHVMDFMPTVLELAGTEYPRILGERHPLPLDGRSLVPAFQGKPRPPRGTLGWSVPRHRVLRQGIWKIIAPTTADAWELYDLEQDPGETTDLATAHADVRRRMIAHWERWRIDVQALRQGPSGNFPRIPDVPDRSRLPTRPE